ncbi:bifunctional aminoglycoside phosphotransferase/ATP-binding protein [Candidatus Nitrospira salsa]
MNPPTSPNIDTLIQSLQNSALYDHDISQFELLETHISWVLLTGPYAYKFKKPVNLGFLDFSTLEQRRFFCREELRLNRRLAPDFYLELVSIFGTPESPTLNGSGEPIEYAVKMKQFPPKALLSQQILESNVTSSHIDELAKSIARFHTHTTVADSSSTFGTPNLLRRPAMSNFEHLVTTPCNVISTQDVEQLKQWTEAEHARCVEHFKNRKSRGYIRECHGDLHLGNIALVENTIVIFDCIEFNEEFRWIDVINEVAFVVMDLIDRGASQLAWRLLNTYLEQTGDYEGLRTFRYYLTYRAMVRAKVTGIRLSQDEKESAEVSKLTEELKKYVALAGSFTKSPHPVLLITHGLSGSGKTTVSQALLESLGAIRIRSDIERKRLLGIPETRKTDKQHTSKVYSKDSTQATYTQLAMLARNILQSGLPVIVDATFLKRAHRDTFAKLAKELQVPFVILDIHAPEAILRQRVISRLKAGRDASEADITVLEQQLSQDEPFSPTEQPFVMEIPTEQPNNLNDVLMEIQQKRKRSTS